MDSEFLSAELQEQSELHGGAHVQPVQHEGVQRLNSGGSSYSSGSRRTPGGQGDENQPQMRKISEFGELGPSPVQGRGDEPRQMRNHLFRDRSASSKASSPAMDGDGSQHMRNINERGDGLVQSPAQSAGKAGERKMGMLQG